MDRKETRCQSFAYLFTAKQHSRHNEMPTNLVLRLKPLILILAFLGPLPGAVAQLENPVYVDDSPAAYEMFLRAQEQVRDNTGEAARLCQELLDEFALKLIPSSEAGRAGGSHDHFTSVRSRVLRLLRTDRAAGESLLQRYRAIETPVAQRMLDMGQLEQLALTRPLTEPGLEALLRLAQRDVESARFESAIRRLDVALEHPDLDELRATHAWFMLGLVGHCLNQPALINESLDGLSALSHESAVPLRARLQRFAAEPRPASLRGVSPLDRTNAEGLTELVSERIWEAGLNDSLFARRTMEAADPHPLARPRTGPVGADGGLMTVAPTIAGDVVYFSQGHTINAVDRYTGSPIWAQPYIERPAMTVIDRDDEQAMDMNSIAISTGGDMLVTLTGHAHATSRSSDGRVICLDARTGAPIWMRRLDRLDGAEDMDGLFPFGAPIIAEGAVFVLARKISPQALTSTYLVSFELDSGATRWARHIVSSGSIRRAARAFSTIVYDNGDLYIGGGVGAVARLNASTGETRWLVRFSVPINPTPHEQARRPWEILSPLVASGAAGGRVIALQPGTRRVLVLDRETGEIIETHDAATREGWNGPAYLLGDDQTLFAVGREVRAFHMENLAAPIWSSHDVDLPPIRGRAQLVGSSLIVPTEGGIFILDSRTGTPLHVLEVEPGNPVAVDSQLLVAGNTRLDAFMSLSRAETMLRERIAAAPNNPEPALALLRLAGRAASSSGLRLALDAADHAMHAIEAGTPEQRAQARSRGGAQRQLFDLLIDLHHRSLDALRNDDTARLLYATLERVAETPTQRLEHQLAHADWLAATGDSVAAANMLHRILIDRELSSLERIEDGRERPAGAWVVSRLAKMPQGAHRTWRTTSAAEPQELFRLASNHPFAPQAVDAAVEASRQLLARNEPRDALAGLLRFMRGTPREGRLSAEQQSRLLAAAAAASEAAGWRVLASRFAAEGRHLSGASGAGERQAATDDSQRLLPDVGVQRGEAEVLMGRLVRRHRFSANRPIPPDRALMMDQLHLSLLVAPDLALAWTIEQPLPMITGAAPELLDMTDRHVLLWYAAIASGDGATGPRAILLRASDGAERWTMPRLDEYINDPLLLMGRNREIREQMPSGEPFDPREIIPLFDDGALVVISRTGSVVGFDLSPLAIDRAHAAGRPAWARSETLEKVHLAELRDGLLVLAGMQRQAAPGGRASGRAALVPAVLVLDARTGEPIHRRKPALTPPLSEAVDEPRTDGWSWMQLAPGGVLIAGWRGGIDVFDLLAGERLGAMVGDAAEQTRQGLALSGERFVFEDVTGTLRAGMIESLQRSEAFDRAPVSDFSNDAAGSIALIPLASPNRVAGGWPVDFISHQPARLVRYSANGDIRGVDIIRDERFYQWVLRGQGKLVIVSAATPPNMGRRSPQMYRLYVVSENCRLLDEPVQLSLLQDSFQDAALMDGWLLLSAPNGTLAVPMPSR
ncbi:MAG TPA: PQQ-binding-like beta-propeller repeat protein [Phycisphaerales bacterium]|nr:PQQ-binding-like beta-propeller repeat protein [Phycisphaerales bacterium]